MSHLFCQNPVSINLRTYAGVQALAWQTRMNSGLLPEDCVSPTSFEPKSWLALAGGAGVFGDEICSIAGHICQRCSDKGDGGWFDPLFDPTAEVFSESEKVCERAGMVARYLVDFPVWYLIWVISPHKRRADELSSRHTILFLKCLRCR